ncbi:MAG: Ribosomal-protein-S5p-alanine acetyltransferase, partial [uncultured Nocardioidaceae bacterium]
GGGVAAAGAGRAIAPLRAHLRRRVRGTGDRHRHHLGLGPLGAGGVLGRPAGRWARRHADGGRAGGRPPLRTGWPASGRDRHPTRECRQPAGGGEARLPGRRGSTRLSAHRRGLAYAPPVRPHPRGGAPRSADALPPALPGARL